jgi:hypothetical protein
MPIFAFGLSAFLGCTTQLPPKALARNNSIPGVAPEPSQNAGGAAAADGYLRIETDADRQLIGGETYYELRRPYDLYADDGHLLQADIDNQGGRREEPILRPITPGRYIVASVYGAAYRKVQVEIRPRTVTNVPAAVLSEAPRVFGD